MPRALVTGASGFAGPYLVRYLLGLGYEVVGGVHGIVGEMPEGSRTVPLDVTDPKGLEKIVAEVRPDEIYHLAGLTRPASGMVKELYRVNLKGTLNLLEATREHAPDSKVLLVGSAYAYGCADRPMQREGGLGTGALRASLLDGGDAGGSPRRAFEGTSHRHPAPGGGHEQGSQGTGMGSTDPAGADRTGYASRCPRRAGV